MRLTATLLLACLPVTPGLLQAQQVQSSVPADSTTAARSSIEKIRGGAIVRVQSGPTLTEGRFVRLLRDTVRMRERVGADLDLPLQRIDGIWSREDSRSTGLVLGTGLGALFAAAVGSVIYGTVDDVFCQDICESDTGSQTASVTLAGAMLGGVAGFVIGKNNTKWKPRFIAR